MSSEIAHSLSDQASPTTDWAADGRGQVGAAATFHPLNAILEGAGFGIEIKSAFGTTVYSNKLGSLAHDLTTEGNANPGRKFRCRKYDVSCGAQDYRVDLTLDETEHDERERELIQKAYFDDLTRLPNRALFERSVQSLIEDGQPPFALAFLDIDGFKQVNDYYGHDTGDELLAKIAERLGGSLRSSDMLARLGGDEFALLISPFGEMDELVETISWIASRIKDPFFVMGHEVFTSASIGVSIYPRDGSNYEMLRSNADRAMYKSKGKAKGSIQFFDSSIEHAAAERSRLEQRLRLAIRDRRVCCAYQPKVDLRSGAVAGIEVLMRWRDEDGAIQPPGEFLQLAIELGLMDDLTHLILAETIRSIDRINEAFGAGCSISINVAARQADNPDFMESLVAALEATGFADRFMLELTEEAFLSKSVFQTRILPLIRKTGARVSIDDFGSGYSSLSALADITADEVKVDRSFITDIHKKPRNQSILKAIEALGHSLGMSVIVEGVETFEELAYLQAATRIKYAQGYYFSQAILLENLEALSISELRPLSLTRSNEPSRTAGYAKSR
jgi:diguanylate cyclase (GGDEF)-like protein